MNKHSTTVPSKSFNPQPFAQAAWYVVQTKPRQEYRALENLINQGYECELPEFQRERLRQGVRVLCNEPLFPRYLFIRLDIVSMNWGPIRSTYGVIGLVRFGGIPASVPDDLVEAMMKRSAPQQNLFSAGDRVSITTGPFAGMEGIFDKDDGVARVVILLEFMQKQQRLSMRVGNVRRLG
jgi:transcriptional antiterminator RfaH